MNEVSARREYQLRLKTPSQSKKLINHISRSLRHTISPNLCEIEISSSQGDPTRIVVGMTCLDGNAVYHADLRSMSRIIQFCEREDINHKIGDLEVITI